MRNCITPSESLCSADILHGIRKHPSQTHTENRLLVLYISSVFFPPYCIRLVRLALFPHAVVRSCGWYNGLMVSVIVLNSFTDARAVCTIYLCCVSCWSTLHFRPCIRTRGASDRTDSWVHTHTHSLRGTTTKFIHLCQRVAYMNGGL